MAPLMSPKQGPPCVGHASHLLASFFQHIKLVPTKRCLQLLPLHHEGAELPSQVVSMGKKTKQQGQKDIIAGRAPRPTTAHMPGRIVKHWERFEKKCDKSGAPGLWLCRCRRHPFWGGCKGKAKGSHSFPPPPLFVDPVSAFVGLSHFFCFLQWTSVCLCCCESRFGHYCQLRHASCKN